MGQWIPVRRRTPPGRACKRAFVKNALEGQTPSMRRGRGMRWILGWAGAPARYRAGAVGARVLVSVCRARPLGCAPLGPCQGLCEAPLRRQGIEETRLETTVSPGLGEEALHPRSERVVGAHDEGVTLMVDGFR